MKVKIIVLYNVRHDTTTAAAEMYRNKTQISIRNFFFVNPSINTLCFPACCQLRKHVVTTWCEYQNHLAAKREIILCVNYPVAKLP